MAYIVLLLIDMIDLKTSSHASLEATVVRNSAVSPTDRLTGVKCRATSVTKSPRDHLLCDWGLIVFLKASRLVESSPPDQTFLRLLNHGCLVYVSLKIAKILSSKHFVPL